MPVGYGYLYVIFVLNMHSGLYTMQASSYLGKLALKSMWFKIVWTQNNNSGVQRFSHLEIPTNYQQFDWYYNFDTTSRFFDTMIDLDY